MLFYNLAIAVTSDYYDKGGKFSIYYCKNIVSNIWCNYSYKNGWQNISVYYPEDWGIPHGTDQQEHTKVATGWADNFDHHHEHGALHLNDPTQEVIIHKTSDVTKVWVLKD